MATLTQHQNFQDNSMTALLEEGTAWIEEINDNVNLTLTELENVRIYEYATQSMYNEHALVVAQRITDETLQFRTWFANLKAKRPETSEEEAFDWFDYNDPEYFVASDHEMEEFLNEAVEELGA